MATATSGGAPHVTIASLRRAVSAMLLAIESSSEQGSVALVDRAGAIVARELLVPRRHNEELLGVVQALLSASGASTRDLQACSFGAGPGSFTGIRLAASAAYALGWAHGIPVFAVDAASASARAAWADQALSAQPDSAVEVVWVSDARVEQLYWARVTRDAAAMPRVRVMQLAAWRALTSPPWGDGPFLAVGDGWRDARMPTGWLESAVAYLPAAIPTAAIIAELAWQRWQAGERPALGAEQPIYLRGADAWDVRAAPAR